MSSSIKLLTVRGIPIRMHITFPLILVISAFLFGSGQADWMRGAAFGVVVTLLLFVGVVLHELAHSLVAVAFGSEVSEIVLLPLGGVARMEQVPEKPYQELLMALAGPVTSGLIGFVLAAMMPLFFPHTWFDIGAQFFRAFFLQVGSLQWTHVLPYLASVNLFLALFNMIPAFPMDGGRVLRALLATVMPYGRATRIAVSIGQGLALLLGLLGFIGGGVMVILVALFVYVGASQEGQMTQVKLALAGLQVQQAFSRRALALAPDDPLGRAVDLTLEGFQSDFPVSDGEQLVGMLTNADVLVGLKELGPDVPVSQAMRTEFPVAHPQDDLFEVQQRMNEAGMPALPVVEGTRFLGLLTKQDLQEVYRLVSINPRLLQEKREKM